MEEEQGAAIADRHLLGKTRIGQRFATFVQHLLDAPAVIETPSVNRSGQLRDATIPWIEEEQAVVGEDGSHRASERRDDSCARSVVLAQKRERFVGRGSGGQVLG